MNFNFLKEMSDFAGLYQSCEQAEKYVYSVPTHSMKHSRNALEYCVKFIYKTAIGDDNPFGSINDLLNDVRFTNYINDREVLNEMHYIRKVCNAAVHEEKGTETEALEVLESLLFVVGELFITLKLLKDYPDFEVPAKPQAGTPTVGVSMQESKKANEPVEVDDKVVAKFAESMRHTKFDVRYKRDSEENRKLFIRASLRESGWPIVEVDNHAKPYSAGSNITIDATDSVDYVLYGRDGKPLAIIEYSETKENPVMGRRKANRVATKLEAQFGHLPVIYYTNGYMINCIDQMGYPQRRIFCFHSLPELELMAQQRTGRKSLENLEIRSDITDRQYQHDAINAVCSAFNEMRRGSLIVMATGTGKTRVSISIVDVLMRYGWIKNVLFLADRTSLVRQAQKNFKKLMPELTTSLYTGESLNKNANAKVIFSTYQSMIRLINSDTRGFGIRRFDLIVVDEAHRSIFSKFGSLFHYFDALMLGLTATPKYQQDKSSYEVFSLPKPEPDYAYELEDALKEKYLVGFTVKDRTTDILKRGFKYDDLTASEIQEIEDSLTDSNYTKNEISTFRRLHSSKVGYRGTVINRGTIREMLNDLMTNGLKLSDGTLGKTIIFADSHEEARVIVEEFNNIFTAYGTEFCKLIDSQVSERYALIDKFEERGSGMQIAVSVEMLETGVDVPDIVNLVFFKRTWSKIKFLQMIGRGTRLSKDLYGPGIDKKGFLIFDYYDNFSFFSQSATWSTVEGSASKGAFDWMIRGDIAQIAWYKMSISHYIQTHDTPATERQYRDELLEDLISQTRLLNNDDIDVQYNMPYVNKYRVAEAWQFLTEDKMKEIADRVFTLFPGDGTNAQVRKFDQIMYGIEEQGVWLAERQPKKGTKTMQDIRLGSTSVTYMLDKIMSGLLEQTHIEEVQKQKELIISMKEGKYVLDNFSLAKTERVRKELRGLMVYLPETLTTYVVDIEDQIQEPRANVATPVSETATAVKSYPERATEYLATTKDPEIAKISNLETLTDEEKKKLTDIFTKKLGTNVDFAMWSGNKEMLPFIRSQVGINDSAITTQFGSFFSKDKLTEEQYAFMEKIIEYAKVNGDIKFTDLMSVEPFKNVDIMQLFGAQAMNVKKMVTTLHNAVM